MVSKTNAEALSKVVAKWRAFLGIPKEGVDPEELAFVIMYIQQYWSVLTLAEIELAFTLSINRKLDDCDFFGHFSPNYVAQVLSSYMHYRKMTLADALRRQEKFNLEEAAKKSKPTPEQERDITRELFKNFHNEVIKNGSINDPFNLAYNFLRANKWMKVSETDIKESMEYANQKYQEDRRKESLLRQVIDNQEVEKKRHARNYLVAKYLRNVDINVLLDNIKTELFTNLD